jgi:3-oxoacyl-(acyl-carrier-protein) synthase
MAQLADGATWWRLRGAPGAMKMALERVGAGRLYPHATRPVGDVPEINAIKTVFGLRPAISATKSLTATAGRGRRMRRSTPC